MTEALNPLRVFIRLFSGKRTQPDMPAETKKPERKMREAKFQIGQVVRHRMFPFRGVVFDVDPVFSNSEEWYNSIPEEVRPHRNQPYYHLFAENDKTHYIAYVSEQNLLVDDNPDPVDHPEIPELFELIDGGRYTLKQHISN